MTETDTMSLIRPPAVADMFYPGNAKMLRKAVQAYLDEAREHTMATLGPPKALIVPHAGYIYSGPVAASAYALLAPLRDQIQRVVLLGPAHRVWVRNLALPAADAFATPLGTIGLDLSGMAELQRYPQIEISPLAHATEHALEVQLPFLQTVLADFKLLPLIVGGARPEAIAEVLDAVWGGEETLLVISSDLSHYHPYAEAHLMDTATVRQILLGDPILHGERACGAAPINGLLLAARQHGLQGHLLDLRSSGDTAGDRARVVGYTAIAFTEVPHALPH